MADYFELQCAVQFTNIYFKKHTHTSKTVTEVLSNCGNLWDKKIKCKTLFWRVVAVNKNVWNMNFHCHKLRHCTEYHRRLQFDSHTLYWPMPCLITDIFCKNRPWAAKVNTNTFYQIMLICIMLQDSNQVCWQHN